MSPTIDTGAGRTTASIARYPGVPRARSLVLIESGKLSYDGGFAVSVVIEGLAMLFLRFAGLMATSSDGRDADGASDDEREFPFERGAAGVGRGLSSSE